MKLVEELFIKGLTEDFFSFVSTAEQVAIKREGEKDVKTDRHNSGRRRIK